jgi:hypothetical protein
MRLQARAAAQPCDTAFLETIQNGPAQLLSPPTFLLKLLKLLQLLKLSQPRPIGR